MQQYGMIYQPNQQGVYQFITIEDVLNAWLALTTTPLAFIRKRLENY